MPVERCDNGKYRIGSGECVYTSRSSAQRAYVAYLAGQKAESYNDYPEAATNNAKRALKWKEENGSSCGTPVGWTRANQLANKERISRDTIARMASFKRHQQHKDVPYEEGCGGLMWDAWGGTEGIEWAIRKLGQIDNKKRNMSIYSYKNLAIEIKDMDKKQGIVSGYFSAFDVMDADGDIIRPGAFAKTLNEMYPKGRIKHLLNHDPSKPLGKLIDLKEDSYGLRYTSQIGKHAIGQDFLKMVDSDLIREHSIGFSDLTPEVKRRGDGYNNITEVKLFEGSSLTAWGANEFTPLIEVKGQDIMTLAERIKKFEKFAKNSDATDETIELCLLYIRQLAQIIEDVTTLDEEDSPMPEEPEMEEEPTINISELQQFINQWTLPK